MKLYNQLPQDIDADGKVYKINPSFDRVLEAFDILKNDWDEAEKVNYLCFLLIQGRPKNKLAALQKVFEVLIEPAREGRKAFDFEQDIAYIYAAFRQAYGIDLFEERDRLHWWAFCALLKSLPADTKLSEIVDIRLRPLPAPTKWNGAERSELARQKATFALKLSDEEREAQYQQGLRQIVSAFKR